MANYVLSYAFSDQIFITYARAAVNGMRETGGEIARRIVARNAARNTGERRIRTIRRHLRSLDRRSLWDIRLA